MGHGSSYADYAILLFHFVLFITFHISYGRAIEKRTRKKDNTRSWQLNIKIKGNRRTCLRHLGVSHRAPFRFVHGWNFVNSKEKWKRGKPFAFKKNPYLSVCLFESWQILIALQHLFVRAHLSQCLSLSLFSIAQFCYLLLSERIHNRHKHTYFSKHSKHGN